MSIQVHPVDGTGELPCWQSMAQEQGVCPARWSRDFSTMIIMSNLATGDRSATREEVLAERRALRTMAARHGPGVDAVGTIVHSDAPGYAPLRRFATEAARSLGVWVNVITDDTSAAQVDTEGL